MAKRSRPGGGQPGQVEREAAATHAAAHAVAAWALGLAVESVAVGDARSELGTPRENALVALVGAQVDARLQATGLRGVPVADHNDIERATVWCCHEAGGDTLRAGDFFEPWAAEASALLTAHAEDVGRVAEVLLAQGAVTGADLVALLGAYPEVGPELAAARARTRQALKAGHVRQPRRR